MRLPWPTKKRPDDAEIAAQLFGDAPVQPPSESRSARGEKRRATREMRRGMKRNKRRKKAYAKARAA